MKPKIKFNNGSGAILCNDCNIIIKENLELEEFQGKTSLLFCEECYEKRVIIELEKVRKRREEITEEIKKLEDEDSELYDRQTELCLHKKSSVHERYEEGDYYNRSCTIKTTLCDDCGKKLDEQITYGGYG